MENKYFAELARRLKEEGASLGEAGDRHLPILLHGQVAMNVTQGGTVLLMPSASVDQEASELYNKVSGLASAVKEYTSAMEHASVLRAMALDPAEGYRLLADFNGVVLAGQELEKDWGYQFATWVRSPDRTGLVDLSQLYTQDQTRAIYRLIRRQLDEDGLDGQDEKLLYEVREKIEHSCPDIESRYLIERLASDPRTGYTLVQGKKRIPYAIGWLDEASGIYSSSPRQEDFPDAQPFEGPYDGLVKLCQEKIQIIEELPEWNYPLVLYELTDAESLAEHVKTKEGYNFGFIIGDVAFVTDQSDMDHWLLAKREDGAWQAVDNISLYQLLAEHGEDYLRKWTEALQSCPVADYPEQLQLPDLSVPTQNEPTM